MAPSLRSALIGGLLLPLVSAQGCPYASMHKRDNNLVERADGDSSQETLDTSFGKCPSISDAAGAGTLSRDWWPCQLRLDVLRQFSGEQNPLGADFDYAAEFAKLDCRFVTLTSTQIPKTFVWEDWMANLRNATQQTRDSRPTSRR